MRDIALDEDAKNDIAEAMAFYEAAQEGLGTEFLEAVKQFLPRIAENPRIYPVARGRFRKAVMNRFPYIVYYQFDDRALEVFGVIHAKRSRRHVARRLKRQS
jgi:plasmid stabilization system protein ParE